MKINNKKIDKRFPVFEKLNAENLPSRGGYYYYFKRSDGLIHYIQWFPAFSLNSQFMKKYKYFAATPPHFPIWAEMARRKVRFHCDESPQSIKLWGLFYPSDVKSLVKKGLLITSDGEKEIPKCITWYYPSPEAYEKYILPLIKKYTLKNLTFLAGWIFESNKDFD